MPRTTTGWNVSVQRGRSVLTIRLSSPRGGCIARDCWASLADAVQGVVLEHLERAEEPSGADRPIRRVELELPTGEPSDELDAGADLCGAEVADQILLLRRRLESCGVTLFVTTGGRSPGGVVRTHRCEPSDVGEPEAARSGLRFWPRQPR